MSEMLKWIETTGGPHVLIPQELVVNWKGVTGWFDNADLRDQSDYARACRVSGWLGVVSCGTGSAVVLSGDVGRVAWLPEAQCFIQWIAGDGENYILDVARNGRLLGALSSSDTEELTFSTGPSGTMHLFDSSESAEASTPDGQTVDFSPGQKVIRAGCFNDARSSVVVRQILAI
jgi:hypothetical protein